MTIKKRLHRSNIYMFLIPLVTAALLLGALLFYRPAAELAKENAAVR